MTDSMAGSCFRRTLPMMVALRMICTAFAQACFQAIHGHGIERRSISPTT
jgi:hypothetical protein